MTAPSKRFADGAISVEDACAHFREGFQPVTGVEVLALRDALDRVLAEDIHAPFDVPAHANSAMDGYALRGADLASDGDTRLQLIGQVLAGHPFAGKVQSGSCVQIMTGGVMPTGSDTVVAQERTQRQGDQIHIEAGQRSGQHVRQAGEDLQRGSLALQAGQRLGPAELGLLASLGMAEVRVLRRLRIAFFSTGDELRPLGQPLGPGDVHDSNRYILHGMIRRAGAVPVDLGLVEDDPQTLQRMLESASEQADVVITTGGVSVGSADHTRTVLARAGQVGFWKVNMKPGRPMAAGRLAGNTAFFGLPGNPVAAMVTFYQIVLPVLQHLSGGQVLAPMLLPARASLAMRKIPGRYEFQRGFFDYDAQGQRQVQLAARQGAGILRSMSRANCFVVLTPDDGPVQAGDMVQIQPFQGLT